MSEWREVALGDLVEDFNRRRIPLSKVQRADRQGPFPYHGAQGVVDHVDDFIFDGDYLLVAEDGENLRSRREPIARLASGRFWVNNHAHVIKAVSGVSDDHFLLHALNQSSLAGRITGAAQPKLTKQNLLASTISCPSFNTQKRVAAVLSAFDELIEINERRIELLENLARLLYREWFVHFRSPGHEEAEMVDSELGRVPAGWRLDSAATVVELNPKVSAKQPTYPKVAMADVSERFSYVLPSARVSKVNGSKFMNGDVLFARITPCLENGKTAFTQFLDADEIAVGSTEFMVLRGRNPIPAFVYCFARSEPTRQHAIRSMSGAQAASVSPVTSSTH